MAQGLFAPAGLFLKTVDIMNGLVSLLAQVGEGLEVNLKKFPVAWLTVGIEHPKGVAPIITGKRRNECTYRTSLSLCMISTPNSTSLMLFTHRPRLPCMTISNGLPVPPSTGKTKELNSRSALMPTAYLARIWVRCGVSIAIRARSMPTPRCIPSRTISNTRLSPAANQARTTPRAEF